VAADEGIGHLATAETHVRALAEKACAALTNLSGRCGETAHPAGTVPSPRSSPATSAHNFRNAARRVLRHDSPAARGAAVRCI
jgi:hypothetical protein